MPADHSEPFEAFYGRGLSTQEKNPKIYRKLFSKKTLPKGLHSAGGGVRWGRRAARCSPQIRKPSLEKLQ